MKVEENEKGFQFISFKDRNGVDCSLQQSSLADYNTPGSSAIWFGTMGNRMHIDLDLLEQLMPFLQKWMEEGSFK